MLDLFGTRKLSSVKASATSSFTPKTRWRSVCESRAEKMPSNSRVESWEFHEQSSQREEKRRRGERRNANRNDSRKDLQRRRVREKIPTSKNYCHAISRTPTSQTTQMIKMMIFRGCQFTKLPQILLLAEWKRKWKSANKVNFRCRIRLRWQKKRKRSCWRRWCRVETRLPKRPNFKCQPSKKIFMLKDATKLSTRFWKPKLPREESQIWKRLTRSRLRPKRFEASQF